MKRVDAFTDGLFAIAMTLLVLEIKLPQPDDGLLHALTVRWPSFAAYAATFLYLGIYWMNVHTISRMIERWDGVLVLLKIVFLMMVAFVPFPTALLAERLTSGHEVGLATAFYALTMLLTAVAINLWFSYAVHRKGLLSASIAPAPVRAMARSYWLGPVIYAVSVPLAIVASSIALLFFFVVNPLYYAVLAARHYPPDA